MSNRYYDFLSDRLVQWIKERESLEGADKFFVLLENQEEASNFYKAIENGKFKGKFEFFSQQYNYKTAGIEAGNTRVLFVAPIEGITQDFLVTIRNKVNTNIEEWKNTAVFFIVYDALDSIIGGAFDTSQKDAPFNVETIQEEIISEIDSQKNLTFGKRKALEIYLEEVTANNSTVLKDYETLFSILEKGDIAKEDFNEMGYFPDNVIDSIPEIIVESRLRNNKYMFDKVEGLQSQTDIEDKLSNSISGDTLIKNLSNSGKWKDIEFSSVAKGISEFNKEKTANLNFDLSKMNDENDFRWFRVEGDSAAKRKRAHLIMSSESITNDEYSFEIHFDDTVNRTSIIDANTYIFEGFGEKVNNLNVQSLNKKVRITIKDFKQSATYGGMLTYRHRGINKLTFKVNFMIVPFKLKGLKAIRPNFRIEVLKSSKRYYFGISPEVENYKFGTVIDNNLDVSTLRSIRGRDIKGYKLILQDSAYEEEENSALRVSTIYDNYLFPISFLDLVIKPIPALPLSIEKQRLSAKEVQFIFDDNKIMAGSNIISVDQVYRERLEVEKEIISNLSLYGKIIGNKIFSEKMQIPEKIEQAYNQLLTYYVSESTLPSLAIFNTRHIELLENVILSINKEINNNLIEDEKIASSITNLAKIGTFIEGDTILFSPLNPLMIAYQLELSKNMDNIEEVPKENILATLNPENLLPYMKINDEEYQSSYTKTMPRWLTYNKMEERQLSELASDIISSRMTDYITQYKFLFESNNSLNLNVAAIQINDELNFFDALVNFMFKRLKEVSSLEEINPINIYFDKLGTQIDSLFHELYEMKDIEDLNNNLKNPYRNSNFEDYEVLELLQTKINVYKIPENKNINDLELFIHITFYQFSQPKAVNSAKMKNLNKSYSLGGLINSPQFRKDKNGYINGFGTGQFMEENQTDLIKFAINWNSLINATNKDSDIFIAGNALANNIPQLNNDEIIPILNNSSWVTLLNLDVDFSYFFDESNGEMLVIHYTDQNATSQYESITVTNDIKQYDRLLKENIFEGLSERKDFDTKEVIKNFNVINGQWLLRLISDKTMRRGNPHILREKLSIISAYKELLGILEHEEIFWVPISLEEVLRVSGMVGLSKKEGLFSSKNLGQSGSISDDLLFVGIDVREERLKLHYLPIEVKVGNNNNDVINKAFNQVNHTSDILKEFLGMGNENTFMREYYKNFFISLTVGNLEKMMSSNVFTTDYITDYQNIKDELSIGEYDISYELEEHYGKGVVFEFTKDNFARQAQLLTSRNVFRVEVPEKDAYNVVADNTVKIVERIQRGEYDFKKEILLSNKVLSSNKHIHSTYENENSKKLIDPNTAVLNNNRSEESRPILSEITSETKNLSLTASEENILDEDDKDLNLQKNSDKSIEKTRLLLGEVSNSNYLINWEYGNKKLANRHMFVTGKSGQGKTYFIQTLLSEFVTNNIGSLVIDYTDGFLTNQLDRSFLSQNEEYIDARIVYAKKLPINPFKLHELNIEGNIFPEKIKDMVERVAQVIDFVFNLGVQQKTLLKRTIIEGYKRNGGTYNFSLLANELEFSEDKSLQNLFGRIEPLLGSDPFSYDEKFDWSQIFGRGKKINIFQLKGYQLDTQKVLVEFLLWDLYQYATRTGSEEFPLPIVLDEIQNLSFNHSSPTVKILREGRKYGISGIFATQSLESIKGNDAEAIYNAGQQVHFLPPDSQVSTISKFITSSASERKEIESSLKELHKGEAIVYGPVLQKNGELSNPILNQVKISSFEKRV